MISKSKARGRVYHFFRLLTRRKNEITTHAWAPGHTVTAVRSGSCSLVLSGLVLIPCWIARELTLRDYSRSEQEGTGYVKFYRSEEKDATRCQTRVNTHTSLYALATVFGVLIQSTLYVIKLN